MLTDLWSLGLPRNVKEFLNGCCGKIALFFGAAKVLSKLGMTSASVACGAIDLAYSLKTVLFRFSTMYCVAVTAGVSRRYGCIFKFTFY